LKVSIKFALIYTYKSSTCHEEVRFGSRIAALLFFYLPLFLALAHEAIPAIAPPELINPVAYITQINVNRGTYISTITHLRMTLNSKVWIASKEAPILLSTYIPCTCVQGYSCNRSSGAYQPRGIHRTNKRQPRGIHHHNHTS